MTEPNVVPIGGEVLTTAPISGPPPPMVPYEPSPVDQTVQPAASS